MISENLTFDQLPLAVSILTKEVGELKRLLIEKQEKAVPDHTDKWFNLNDLIQYDPEKRTKATWYSKISKGEAPQYHKKGKKVYFLKSDIDNWLREGKCKPIQEIEAEATAYLSTKKKGPLK